MSTVAPDWVSFHSQRHAGALALESVDFGTQRSWGALQERVSAVAGMLAERFGVSPGDRVALIAENDFRVFEVQFACMRIGAIFVPLNWRLTPVELSALLADCRPSLLLHDEVWADVAATLGQQADRPIRVAGWDQAGGEYEAEATRSRPITTGHAGFDDPTHILYTSGTTGLPKGAIVTHRTLLSQLQNVFIDCRLGSADAKYLNPMPLFHAGGLTTLCAPVLAAGGAVAFARRFDPQTCLDWMADPARGITHFNGSPIFFEQIAACPGFGSVRLDRLRHAHLAGATIVEQLIESWLGAGVAVQQFYGGTEFGPSAMGLPADRVLDKPGSCGLPLLLTRTRLVDGDLRDVAPGGEGEILLSGPAITPGYWGRTASTADFVDGWIRTGDVARQDEDGFYYIIDRVKDVYKSGGESVFPAEIERALLELPTVQEVAVVGMPDDHWGEIGWAFVVPSQGAAPTLADLRAHLEGRFARYKLPKSIALLDALPRNVLGKTDKKALRQSHQPAPA